MNREFLWQCFKVLKSYENTGLLCIVGSGPNHVVKHTFFFLSGIIADQPAKDQLGGPSYSRRNSKCSSCVHFNASEIGVLAGEIIYRDDVTY